MKADVRATIRARLDCCDWAGTRSSLFERGFATLPRLLSDAECDAQLKLYGDEHRFRKTVDMARHNFGEGEYKYFADPLPPLVAALRTEITAVNKLLSDIDTKVSQGGALADQDIATLEAALADLKNLAAKYGTGSGK